MTRNDSARARMMPASQREVVQDSDEDENEDEDDDAPVLLSSSPLRPLLLRRLMPLPGGWWWDIDGLCATLGYMELIALVLPCTTGPDGGDEHSDETRNGLLMHRWMGIWGYNTQECVCKRREVEDGVMLSSIRDASLGTVGS